MTNGKPDAIGQAIAASAPATRMQAGRIRLSSGREVQISFPADLSDTECCDLAGEILTAVRQAARKAKSAPRILIPRT